MTVRIHCQPTLFQRGSYEASRKGAQVVEFALTVPILFMLVMAGIEFYRISMLRQFAENVSYEAARNIIVPGSKVAEGLTAANV